jgi:hypothetical protein
MADIKQDRKLLDEFSPEFFSKGLVGLLLAEDVDKVEINIVFHKKLAVNTNDGANLQPTTSQNGTVGKPQVAESTTTTAIG